MNAPVLRVQYQIVVRGSSRMLIIPLERIEPMKNWGARLAARVTALAFLIGGGTCAVADTIFVDVQNNFFSPNVVAVATGDTVEWRCNQGTHTTTSSDGLWDSGNLSSGSTFDFTFNQSGNFDYVCTIHFSCCNMKGTVQVVDPVQLQGALTTSGIDPDATGQANYEMRPYRTVLNVSVQAVFSTTAVDVFVNGVGPIGQIMLDSTGSGTLMLNSQQGDMVPTLQAGDEIEVLDASDDVTLLLVGTVS
jgi:plastocyanin